MARIYGPLIRAQLQLSATDLVPATGLIYFNTSTGPKWHNGSVWLTAADLSSQQSLTNKVISSTDSISGALLLPVGTEAQRPVSPMAGMIRYNTSTNSFEGYGNSTWSGIGGGGTTDLITQAGHGFFVGDVLYLNNSVYTKALASASNTAEVVGVVSRIISETQFELTLSGEVSGLSGLVAGEVYFLSATTAGVLTTTEPSVVGHVSVPVGVASSATSLYVAPKRGAVIGGANVRTQISLANNATNTVQNVSAYEAGELTGWVSIAASTSSRFYISVKFSKNGANNDYNLNYQTVGDNPPVGFSIQVTSAGIIQAVMPSVTGFTSASINYALNAPAVGTTFPLSVNQSSVVVSNTASEYAGNTKAGLMQYTGGVAYNNAVTLAVSSSTAVTSSSYKFVPYQMSDGSWRLKFNFSATFSASTTSNTFTISGVVFKNIAGTSYQAGSAVNSAVPAGVTALCDNNAATVRCFSTVAANQWAISGDVELNAQPTWAY